jgi:hypothetical protein
MTNDNKCPACGTMEVAAGQFFGRRPFGFLPAGLRFWTLKARPVPFPTDTNPRACTKCGLVWLRVDAAVLRQIITEAGRSGGSASRRAV